jgi:FtsP/CotA-like multicopper oxidase with cupredoxin domain
MLTRAAGSPPQGGAGRVADRRPADRTAQAHRAWGSEEEPPVLPAKPPSDDGGDVIVRGCFVDFRTRDLPQTTPGRWGTEQGASRCSRPRREPTVAPCEPISQPRGRLEQSPSNGAGTKVFDLRLEPGSSHFLPGKTTPTWGVNGAYLGPTLHASRGDRVRINVSNRLPEATTLHWHGRHLPARPDGGPHQLIAPGATLWYHPHLHGETEDHVDRGLSGLFLLDDPRASALPLPKRYGVDDIPVIVQDKRFQSNGELGFGEPLASPIGRLGGDILINGTYAPHLDVGTRLVRFRLLNASTARSYDLGFADGRAFDQIATDGGLLGAPYHTTRVPLSPGERAEIVAAFKPGERACGKRRWSILCWRAIGPTAAPGAGMRPPPAPSSSIISRACWKTC